MELHIFQLQLIAERWLKLKHCSVPVAATVVRPIGKLKDAIVPVGPVKYCKHPVVPA